MLRTNLDTWRAALFVSLGLAASACAGRAESRGVEEEDTGETGETGETGAGSVDELPEAAVVLAEHLRCESDTPFEEGGPGAMRCANGIVHRPVAPSQPECVGCVMAGPVFGNDPDLCASDDDCALGTLCVTSVELAASQCQGPIPSLPLYFFACQAPEDECGTDAQCGAQQTCVMVGDRRECTAHIPCEPEAPIPGRPFLVGAEARVAGVCSSSDWHGPRLAPPEALDARSLSIAAAHWQSAAQMEHASIAAFARFTLQLLQLGAPLELVVQSQRAMRDETEHARRCFALAARYARAPVGPTALAITGALEEESLASIVRLAFREGCIGETCAALEAAEALALAKDEIVRQTLELIAPDEQRHAELAWRFVAWALEQDTTGEVRAIMQAELARLRAERAVAGHPGSPCVEAERGSALQDHGVPDAGRSSELRRAAITQVVLPCAERLLATSDPPRPRSGAVEAPAALSST